MKYLLTIIAANIVALSAYAQTNVVVQPTLHQRLQFWYASQPGAPAPGAESPRWTIPAPGTFTWSSSLPAPTAAQLAAINSKQVSLLREAGTFTAGAYRIVTSTGSVTVQGFNPTDQQAADLRKQAERDRKNANPVGAYRAFKALQADLAAAPFNVAVDEPEELKGKLVAVLTAVATENAKQKAAVQNAPNNIPDKVAAILARQDWQDKATMMLLKYAALIDRREQEKK